jgi:uncharacterized protein involved in type VI secretion and phage assembly
MLGGSGGQVGARPVLAVNGADLSTRLAGQIRQVIVDTDATGPDSCRVLLDDPARDVLKRSGIDLNADFTVTAGRVGDETGDRLFDGVVYSLGFDFDDRGAFSTVVAYDRSYGLYNGLHTKTYQNLTDSDLASQLADEVGLAAGEVSPTDVVHEHLAQVNETHFEFLTRRAREVNRVLLVTGSKLHFTEPADASGGPDPGDFQSRDRLQLVPGANVERLTARITAAQQVSEVEVRGWDPQRKQAVSATAPAKSTAAELHDEPATVAGNFGSPRHVTVDLPLTTQAEADAVAAAQAERMASTFAHAEGVARGDPRIVAGAAVSLGQTGGGRFDGKLTVSRAKHTWDRHGYHTSFTVSGAHDRSVLGLLSRDDHRGRGHRMAGLVLGVVTNCSDDRGRVKIKFPWLSDDYESDWVRVLQLGAGANRGLVLLPEVNDEVLVGFEHGDTRRPYVLGGLFNGVDTAPFGNAVDANAGTVITRGFRTRAGHELIFTDTEGKERIELHTKDSKVAFTLDAANGNLTVEAKGDVVVKATGNASITAGKDFTVEATGSGTIHAKKGLTLQSDGDVKVKGKAIALN